jgi:hypothetical protein
MLKTNLLLKANLFDKLDEALPEEIAKVLGVDAVIKCFMMKKTGSEGVLLLKPY